MVTGEGPRRGWFGRLDDLLRGDATRPESLRGGSLDVPAGGMLGVIMLLGAVYGACMGSYAVTHAGGSGWIQIPASAVKVPALFLLTLLVTSPSLYVFNTLVGSRLRFPVMARLLLASTAITLAVLASLGPIVAFFSVVTESYRFVQLMNVAAFALSGVLGLGFLFRTLNRLPEVPPSPEALDAAPETAEGGATPSMGVLERDAAARPEVQFIFSVWTVLFGLVGAQMSWVLRPFIGSPGKPFTWLRERESNFFEAVWASLTGMF